MGNTLSATTTKPTIIDTLVFSGGSSKAIAHCGALMELAEYDCNGNTRIKQYIQIKRFIGTSAGSIIASLLAVGYKPNELYDIMKKMDLIELIETDYKVSELYNLTEYYGVHKGDAFCDFIGNLIEKKTGDSNYTVQQLYDEHNITLVINATNLNGQRTDYFYPNHCDKVFSNVPIKLAVRMSMSIPIFFSPVLFNDNYYVDGGVLDNYAIDWCNLESRSNGSVLGFNIITDHDLKVCENKLCDKILCWSDYLTLLINLNSVDNIRKQLTDKSNTVEIITPDISPICFTLSDKQKEYLVETGREAVKKYFS